MCNDGWYSCTLTQTCWHLTGALTQTVNRLAEDPRDRLRDEEDHKRGRLVTRQTAEANNTDRLLRVDVEKKVERCKGGIAELFTGDLVNRTEESKLLWDC
jgi:hypothetical protein